MGGGVDPNQGQCNVPASAKRCVSAIAAATYHSLALKKDGSVVAWGCGHGYEYGQCLVPALASWPGAAAATTTGSVAPDFGQERR